MVAAATNSGDNGSGAMGLAWEKPCWVSSRRRKGKGSGNGGAAAEVMAATGEGDGGSGLIW